MKSKILVIDDEPDIRQLLSMTLERMGFDVSTAENVNIAKQLLEKTVYQLCITDLKLPDGSGLDIVKRIAEHHSATPVIVITAHGSMDIAIKAMKIGAFDFINKPFDLKHFRQLVSNATSTIQIDTEDNPLSEIVGNSSTIEKLKAKVAQLSRSQAPIFITGESGSGKEVIANAIHRHSSRKDKPFIAINCGAIPKELMESELFGHKKGSFTGAHEDRQGLFQAADGGTLLLDEIADLPLDMQVKLLRVIQEKSIRPIGSQKEIPIDVRLLSASHQHLIDAVHNKTFRNDLYYRLNVIEVAVPALRDRIDDIPVLSAFILNKISQRNNFPPVSLSNSAIEALENYSFPGNIRELENVLERACALTETDKIEPHHISLTSQSIQSTKKSPTSSVELALQHNIQKKHQEIPLYDPTTESIDSYLEKIEKDILLNALHNMRWNRTATAKKLGISFRSLRYRLKKLNIDDLNTP